MPGPQTTEQVEVPQEAVEAAAAVPSAFVGSANICETAAREVLEAAYPAIASKIREQERARALIAVAEAFETRPANEAMRCSEVALYCREQAALNPEEQSQ